MDFNPMMMLPTIDRKTGRTKSPSEVARKKKKRQMAKASRRMNRYQTNGHRTKSHKLSLRRAQI